MYLGPVIVEFCTKSNLSPKQEVQMVEAFLVLLVSVLSIRTNLGNQQPHLAFRQLYALVFEQVC